MTGSRFHFVFALRVVLVFSAIALAAVAGRAQAAAGSGTSFDPSQINTRFPDKTVNVDHQDESQDQRRLRLLNTARQKAMVSDAARLLALARQLNAGVDENGATLNAGQRLKIAAEIEKLAHSVKDRMTNAIAIAPGPANPFHSW